MITEYWFWKWLGAARQKAITWTSVDQDLLHHKASLGHNELIYDKGKFVMYEYEEQLVYTY